MSHTTPLRAVAWRRAVSAAVAAVLLWVILPAPSAQAATGQRVDLKVLLVSNGGAQTAAFATLMQREGVPFTTINLGTAGRPVITEAFLSDPATGRGYYQAVVVPDQLGTGLSVAEQVALASYERSYGVRHVDAYVFPGASTGQAGVAFSGSLDGAPATVTSQGLAGPFAYLNGTLAIDNFDAAIDEVYGYLAAPASGLPAGETFTPLVNATAGGQTGAIVGVYEHDFREELVITAAYNSDQQWFTEVGHGILTWMTRGLHLGYHRNYLNVQADDVFLSDSRWSATLNCTPGDTPTCIDPTATDIRMTSADVTRLTAWQAANNFTFDLAFNAQGSDAAIAEFGSDPLTTSFLAVKDQYTWVNHTYTHTFLGCIQIAPTVASGSWHCAVPGETGPYYDAELVAGGFETTIGGVRWLSQAKIESEITLNQQWASARGLPNFDPTALVTGEHSGLLNDPQQPIDNPLLAPALQAAGITYTASDASRETNSRAVQGGTTMTVPRHPMNIFYNAGRYRDEVDEYNWIYTSAANGGSGICTANPTTSTCITPLANANATQAQASFLNYIVPQEVRTAYRFVITNDPRPFYAHQSNLAEDGILFPVVKGILDKYRGTYNSANSPIVTDDLASLGQTLNRMTAWGSAQSGVSAYVDAAGVHVSGPAGTPVPLTVPAGTTVNGTPFGSYDAELSGWLSATAAGAIVAVPATPMGGYIGHTIPDAPTAVLGVSGATAGSVNLTWSAPANDGNAPITGYQVQYSLDSATPSWTALATLGNVTSTTVTGLVESSNYIFQVHAINAFGNGPWSASSPPAMALPVQYPAASTGVSSPDVQFGTAAAVTLSVGTTQGHVPSGTATLTINGNTYSQILAGNTAVFSVPGLAVGTYAYSVDYAADLHIQGFSLAGSVVVTKATVAAAGVVVSAPTPQVTGTYTVTVTQPAGLIAPTGDVTVTLTDGVTTTPVTGTLTDGTVTLTLPALAAGTWAASVAYPGDANYAAVTSPGESVVSAKTAVDSVVGEVIGAPTPQLTGTYRATVTQPSGLAIPTGNVTVTFTKGSATETATGALVSGVVTVTVPLLAAGTWEASVAYAGDANYAALTSAGASVVSVKAEVSSVVGAVGDAPTTTASGSYVVTVTQPSGLAAATGNVTVTFAKGSATETVTGALSGGAVTLTVPNLAAGTWDASVAYAGDANYSAATVSGAAVTSTKTAVDAVVGVVANEPTTTTIGSYTVTVTTASGLPVATGDVTVTFSKGSATREVTGTLVDGTVTVELPSLAAGAWDASVAYEGDSIYAAKTVTGGSLVSGKTSVDGVAGVLVTAPTPQLAGSYTVTVTQPSGLAVATGDVTVTLTNGTDTQAVTGALVDGAVTVELPGLAAGTWDASVAYAGDDTYAATTVAGASVVSAKTDVTSVVGTVTTKPTTTKAGAYTVTVTAPSGLAKASGQVTVTLKLGTATKTIVGTLTNGAVKVVVPKLTAGTWKATVAYAGDANYLAKTSAGASVVSAKTAVSKVATSVSKIPTSKYSGSYKVTVTAAKGLAKPTGKVTVTLKKGTVTKKVSGTLKSGVVTITVPKLAKGTWRATVTYAGSTTYLAKSVTGKSVVVWK